MDATSEFAAALEADRAQVLWSFQRALDEMGGPIAGDPVAPRAAGHLELRDSLRRIARELHDRMGLWLSAAHHQLELYEIDKQRNGPSGVGEHVTKAKEAAQEAMRILRAVTSDLRLMESEQNLAKALRTTLGALPSGDATITLNVNGDEMWAPAAVKDKSFLVILEAVRDRVAHAGPKRILVNVYIVPRELRAYIDDDGSGFEPEQAMGCEGLGVDSMRERTGLTGGDFSISGSPGGGTHVKVFIPFPGKAYERN